MPNWKKLITSGSSATLSGLTLSGVATPEILFNGTSDAGVDFAIKATPEGLNFYEPEDTNKVHFQIKDDLGVSATYGYQVNGTSVISSGRVLQNVSGNISMFTNDSGYITDGNTGWNNTYGFTTCTGTTTPSNTQTFTNKGGNISQWTNDSGYITDGNSGWNNSYGFTTCTGTTTPSNTQTFTNKSGDISQWTNDSGFTTCTGTTTPSNSQTFTNKGGNISQWTNNSGYTTNTGTLTPSGTINENEFAVWKTGTALKALTAGEMRTALNVPNTTTVITNNNQLTNGAGYITDGNTNWNNSYGFTTCTGTTTPSNSQTFTNKGGNISQWTNDSGYITSFTNTNQLTTFQVEDGDGTEVTISQGKEWKFTEGESININWTDTSNGSDSDPYDLQFSLKTAGVGAGTYGSTANGTKIDQITVDAYGRVTNVATGATGTSNLTLGTTSGTALAGNTTVNDVSVACLKTRLAGGFGSNAVSIGDSTDTVTIPGELVVTGTVTTNNVQTVSTSNGVIFEGNAADANEGTLLAGTLSADRTYTLPNKTGTVALTDDIPSVYNATLTVEGTGALGGSGTFTANQSSNTTISISHDDTSTQSSVNNSGNTVIQDVTLDGYGHVTGLTSKALSIPTVNNANITIGAGSSVLTLNGTAGGTEIFTTNQGIAEQITIDHATNGSQGSVNNSGNVVIQDVTLDAYGHVTGLTSKTLSIPSISGLTSCTGDITQVCITAGDGLTGDVNTTSGNHLQTIDVDSTVVRTSGNQTIGGIKTFNSSATFAGGFTSDDPVTFDSDITVTGITSGEHNEALVINGSGEVFSRTLGTNAFSSTAFTTCTGTVTGVTAGNAGIDIGGTAAAPTVCLDLTEITLGAGLDSTTTGLTLDLSELTDMTAAVSTTVDELILLDNGAERRKRFSEIFGSNAYNSTAIPSTESIQDIVGAMFSSNTETRISATYQDGDGTIDLVVDDMNGGGISGAGSNNRLAVWSGGTSLDSDSDLTWSGDILGVTGTLKVSMANSDSITMGGGTSVNNGTLTSILGADDSEIGSGNVSAAIVTGCNHLIDNNSSFSFIGGGVSNAIDGSITGSVIVGGRNNKIIRDNGTIVSGGCCGTTEVFRGTGFIGAGIGNQLEGDNSVLVGGINNCVDTCCGIIVGGESNCVANFSYATIVGGHCNDTLSCAAFIGAGYSNCIYNSAYSSVIVGGVSNVLNGSSYAGILGGGYNCISTNSSYSSIGAGRNNTLCYGCCSLIAGGSNNTIKCTGNCCSPNACNSSILGGNKNSLSGSFGATVGGQSNQLFGTATYGFIGTGYGNRVIACEGAIITGRQNKVSETAVSGIIGGGRCNCISTGCNSAIVGGCQNFVCGIASTIAGGCLNQIINSSSTGCAAILGGCNNKICTAIFASAVGVSNTVSHACSHAIGAGLTSTAIRTTYMNNTTVACHLQVGGTTTLNSTTGRIDATNDVVAFSTSDRRLKENIKPIDNALCKVIGITGNTFDWKELSEEEVQTVHGNKGNDVGVIAQEIEEVLPQAVTNRENGYKAVNYEKIVPLLIEAIKDQQKQIDELKSKA